MSTCDKASLRAALAHMFGLSLSAALATSLAASSERIQPTYHSCAWGGKFGPCPPPTWKPQFQLNLSTVLQPCNASGYFEFGHQFGLVSFDWSNAKASWSQKTNNETNCQEMLVEQARLVKEKSPGTKVFVYRNLELAVEFLSSQRQVMYDPAKKDWFLQYQSGPQKGDIYSEQQLHDLKQYFWDFRNPNAVQFWVDEVVGPGAAGSEYVDGIFTDDVKGEFEEHRKAIANLGYSFTDVQAIMDANNHAYDKILTSLRSGDAYNWQAFGTGDGVSSGVSQSNCTQDMRGLCARGQAKDVPALMSDGGPGQIQDQVIAGFLIARAHYWWLGSGWEDCHDKNMHPHSATLDMDVGKPVGDCEESSPGVFQRQYSQGTVSLDCNSWKASFAFGKGILV